MVLIPMNMRDGCLIAKGKGNKIGNFSAPHGAKGLCQNRSKKKTWLEEYKKSMIYLYNISFKRK